MIGIRELVSSIAALGLILSAFGCGSPSKANIELRKKNQDLADQIQELQRQHLADAASIKAQQEHIGTLPTLPVDRLNQLVTTHGIRLGKLTGGDDTSAQQPGDEGIKVYVVPFDADGQPIKAAGDFKIELFDLGADGKKLGEWDIKSADALKHFYSMLTLYAYALSCPWQQIPQHPDLTVRVTFNDLLTQRTFTTDKQIHVNLPAPLPNPASKPTSPQ